jgi:pantoate--beta-alanine ligase
VSIFVNPLQFNNKEDLSRYPSQIDTDLALLKTVHCDAVFLPDTKQIYPNEEIALKGWDETNLTTVLEGQFRPGHFEGVAKVLYRLFEIIKPDRVYFGLKDYQQCLLVKQVISKYFPEIQFIPVETVREESGLALSSRNQRLSEQGREKASIIYKAMKSAAEQFPHNSPEDCKQAGKNLLNANKIEIEYFEICDAETLIQPIEWDFESKYIILTAVYIEGVRLIDNLFINEPRK